MRVAFKWSVLAAGCLMACSFAAPALASGNVAVTLTNGSGGTRTLILDEADGVTALTSLDLSSGTNSFVAKVQDSSYSNNGFVVQATMSNLYSYNSSDNTYSCATKVPSSAVTLSSPSGLLDVAGISVGLTPVFQITGTLTQSIDPLLPVGGVAINDTIDGVAQTASTLTQTALGLPGGDLFGTTLAGVLSKLPVSVSTGAGGAFTTPAADPAGASCGVNGSGATSVPIMNGTANVLGLVADLNNLIGSNPTVYQLIQSGYLSASAVANDIESNPTLQQDLGLTGIINDLTNIEKALTATVTDLVSGVTSQSGNYSSRPGLAVNTSGLPTGSFKGLMTVTLMDQ